jgi:hypothetical protein
MGRERSFGSPLWLDGMRQKDIAPLIFDISKKKKNAWLVRLWITSFGYLKFIPTVASP